jgi:hypothetical protein
MNAKLDIEELLRRFRSEPNPRVKRTVLSRYAERCSRARGVAGAAELWRKPVPLYFVAALIVVAAGLSFVGGQKLSRAERSAEEASAYMQDTLTSAALEQRWQFAPRDVL